MHEFIAPPDPAWGDFCWHVVTDDQEPQRCGWTRADHDEHPEAGA